MKQKEKSDIIIYQASNGAIELKGDGDKETIRANQNDIAKVFGIDRSVVTKHIKNIFGDQELDEKVVSAKFAHTSIHGAIKGKTQTKEVIYYNLDIILAVGYRTKSSIAIKFRQRATQTLKKHITDGFTINSSRIEKNYQLFLKAVEDVKTLTTNKNISSDDILELIKVFGQTWFSLDAFDKGTIQLKHHTQKTIKIQANELSQDIQILKKNLIKKKEATDFFAQEKRSGNLEGIIGTVFQSAFGEDSYGTIESKAAHLLYFIIKNHPFTDGNKRTGAFAFIRFLNKVGYDFRSTITPESLTVLTLLIATSDPKDKERITSLVMLVLSGK